MTNVRRSGIAVLLLICATAPAVAGTGQWTRHGPFGGDVTALAVDPTLPSTLYAGTRFGGLWKSVDGGGTWAEISRGLPRPDRFEASAIVVDPRSPSTVYAGFRNSRGVWKSTDGGDTWSLASEGLVRWNIRDLVIDPTSSALYAVDGFGLARSVDGARSWRSLNQVLGAFALHPGDPSTLYALGSSLFTSTDGGESWVEAGASLPRFAEFLLVDPSAPSTLYAGYRSGGVHKSVDGGATWTFVSEELTSLLLTALAIDPRDPSVLYAATHFRGMFRSTDGGASWQPATQGLPNTIDVQTIAVDPSSSTLYAGTQGGGVFRSSDGGGGWSAVNEGLAASLVTSLAVTPSAVYAGTIGAGAFRSADGGETWEAISEGLTIPSVQALAVDPRTPSTLYAGTAGAGVFKTTDGGASWTAVNEGLERRFIQSLVVDPRTPATLYAASGVETWKSDDGGASWRPLVPGDARARSLAIHPASPETVYAVSSKWDVLRWTDGGESWAAHDDGLRARRLLTLAIHPQDPSTLYLGAYNGFSGLYESTDGGESWRLLSRAVVPQSLAIDPQVPSTLYAANGGSRAFDGVSRSRDGGRTWIDLGTGLTHRRVDVVALDPRMPTRVYAGTSGGGVFAIDLPREQTVLELRDGRFRFEVEWRDFQGATGPGVVAELYPPGDAAPLRSKDSTVVEFFSPDNWEVLAKVLDGRSVNDHWWVFLASATDVGFTTTVTDTRCGVARTYVQPAGAPARAVTDVEAFSRCAFEEPPSCRERGGVLCLGDFGEFQVEIDWIDPAGRTGVGRQARLANAGAARSDDSGIFYFFTENNWELLVKVLDGCALNDHFWVFGAATTNVEYTLRVTDTATGAVRTYHNPLGVASPAITDTEAFATCPAP